MAGGHPTSPTHLAVGTGLGIGSPIEGSHGTASAATPLPSLPQAIGAATRRYTPFFGGRQPFMYIDLPDEALQCASTLLCVLAQTNPQCDYCPALPMMLALLLTGLPHPASQAGHRPEG